MTALQWLRRTCGTWTSERRYLFSPAMKPVNMTTEFTISEGKHGKFVVDWTGQTAGQMILTLDGSTLHRSRDYFGDGANSSVIEVIDHDCLVLRTQYDGMRFREEVRMIEEDCFRLRQTVGYDLRTGQLRIAGQYIETRI